MIFDGSILEKLQVVHIKSFNDMQVSFLNQEFVIEKIQSVVGSKLRSSNESRTFQEQVRHLPNSCL